MSRIVTFTYVKVEFLFRHSAKQLVIVIFRPVRSAVFISF